MTIDKAWQQIFYQGITEIYILEKGWGETSSSFKKLAGNIYRNKNKLYYTLLKEMMVSSYPSFCQFLATFYAACRRYILVSQLLHDADFDTKGLLPLNEFNTIMSNIQMMGGKDGSSSSTPAWMRVERTYNEEVYVP